MSGSVKRGAGKLPRGPLPSALRPLVRPIARAYGWAVARRNARFARGIGIERANIPVISVGNLTMGGTGKSPLVAWIARGLRAARLEPVIVMRGYRAPPTGAAGDEEAEYRWVLPDPNVIADPQRASALRRFLPAHPAVKCAVLDDGFQHRQLARDLDLVLIDATADTLHDELLPAGWLREPLESLARADAVIVTRADGVDDELAANIRRYHGRPPLAWARHAWNGLLFFDERRDSAPPKDVSWLQGKRVLTMLGIAKPQTMIAQLERAGAKVAVNIPAGDHERYDRAKLVTAQGLASACDAMVVTRKDWVKLRSLIDWRHWPPTPIVVPNLEIEIFAGEHALAERVIATASVPRG